jgi:alpha-L-fucosidase
MLRNQWIKRSLVVWLGLVVCSLTACSVKQVKPKSIKESADFLRADKQDVKKWQEMKFGLFIHWGPVSLKGTEIGWSRGGERRGRNDKSTGSIPVEIYDNLYKQFNPVKFDADEWVQIAKDAGMKYLVFTSKHHDGFSMFNSKLTDYKITNSPFKRDVVRELADACHKAGLKLGYYYSPVDWYHPDYRTENHPQYIRFLHGQLREICSNYGKIDIIWFDGLGGKAEDWDSENLFRMIRQLQPHVIINNRAGLPADHDTPEQRIGKFQNDRPWETCMTICRQWAWKPGDQMKSLKQCIDTLIRIVGGDGNLLFNVGPMPDGRIEPRQVARLKEMGNWLDKYGKSIYATRGGPFKPGNWGASTYKGNTIYVHVLNWQEDTLTLPPIPKNIIASSLLTGGTVTVRQTRQATEISVPKIYRKEIDTIIVLQLDGPANEISSRALLSGSLTAEKKAKASNVYRNSAAYDAAKAVDDDPATRWATDTGTEQARLEVDLGKPMTFNRVKISEEYGRVREFELQCRDGSQWKTFARGTKLGHDYSQQFEPVTARYVRLNILKATEGPTIWEFHLFPPKK